VFELVRVAKVTPIASWIGAVMVEANSEETLSVSLGVLSLDEDLKVEVLGNSQVYLLPNTPSFEAC